MRQPARRARCQRAILERQEIEDASTDKPNILVIWGDDIGIANLAAIRTA